MSSAYEETRQAKDIEPARAKDDAKSKEKLQDHAGATVESASTAVASHALDPKKKEEEKAQTLGTAETRAGEKETREAVKDPDSLMKRPEAAKEKDHETLRLTGPFASLKHFPPELFDAIKELEELVQKGMRAREFEAKLKELIPDAKLQAELRVLAGPQLLGDATAPSAASSAPATPAH